MAPPTLPNEILAHILELLCESRLYDRRSVMQTLLNCALASRRLSRLAVEQLYRRLTVNIDEDEEGGYLISDAVRLESTLLRHKTLGFATRELRVICTFREDSDVQLEADAQAARTLGTFLACCPNLGAVCLGGLSPLALRDALEHLGESTRPLRRLELLKGAEEEAMRVQDLSAGVSRLLNVTGLSIHRTLDAAGASTVDSDGKPKPRLNFLHLGRDSYAALPLLASASTDTLSHIVLDVSDAWDSAHLYRCLPTFARLAKIELQLPDLLDLERLLPTLARCTSLLHLHIEVTPLPSVHEATKFRHLDFSCLSSSLLTFRVFNTGIPFPPLKSLWLHTTDCMYYVDRRYWTEEEKREWEEL